MTTFDSRRICSTLNEHGVEYVVVGGFAGRDKDVRALPYLESLRDQRDRHD